MAIKKIMVITWSCFQRRAELLAEHLDATLHFVQYGESGKVLQAFFRYPVLALQTWRILKKECPDIILVSNPPIFCALVTAFYAWRYGARYIIDSHTGAFVSWKWRWSLGLHRLLSRRALTTLVHNNAQETIVKRWGCPYLVVGHIPGDYEVGRVPFSLENTFNIVVISSFNPDESPDVVFEAASQLPEITFYITGNAGRLPQHVLSKKPANCRLTGFLPYERYVGLLHSADVVMALTTHSDTLLMGGFEAVSLGKPLITSDWPVLREYFSSGTVHIPYTVQGICKGVQQAQVDYDSLKQGILELGDLLDREWKQKLRELQNLIHLQKS
jgi:glycosyltransferase involved in cell wall biosynthesis